MDGWFRTGDLGEQRPDGAWRIIGRVKEQFKTGKGKYVSPVPIESELAACPLIEQVCVMGSGRKQPLALVVLAPGQGDRAAADAALRALRERVNAVLESHERLDCILVCPEPWTIENGMLTPTLKLKRDRIEAVYAARVEALASPEPVVWLTA